MSTFQTKTHSEKTAKQCRERYIIIYPRWKYHINPSITKEQFTDEEAKIVFNAFKEYGSKWVDIAKLLPHR